MNRSEIIDLRLAGLTYSEIAQRAGISRQRVHQLVAPPKHIRNQVIELAEGKCLSCGVVVGRRGHVHHGAPDHQDGDWYNEITRLQLLCSSCHGRVHRAGEVTDADHVNGIRAINAGRLKCVRCGYEWSPLVADPVACPRCKSYNWQEEGWSDPD